MKICGRIRGHWDGISAALGGAHTVLRDDRGREVGEIISVRVEGDALVMEATITDERCRAILSEDAIRGVSLESGSE